MEINAISIIEPVGGHGGMDYYDYGLASGLANNNLKVDFHTCAKTNIRTYDQVRTFHTFKNLWQYSKVRKFFLYSYYHFKAFQQAKKQKHKVVHLHFFDFHPGNLAILLLAKLFPFKVVVTVHDVESFHKSSAKLVERLSYSLIDGVIVHNESSYNELLKKNYKLPPGKIIPHGNYLPFIEKPERSEFSEKLRLLFFGQIKEVKGLDILLNALAIAKRENKDIKLTIAGRPWKTEANKYTELIKQLGLGDCVETHFRYIPDNEIANFYENADLVVLPYRRIYQSGVLLLTMSYGRAAITSNLQAFEEIITNNINGFTFESENSESLAQCILDLTSEKITEATENAFLTITDKYDWTNIGEQTLEFYQSL